jgi:hypothetical protein
VFLIKISYFQKRLLGFPLLIRGAVTLLCEAEEI